MPFYREFELDCASVAVWQITESADELLSMVPSDSAAEALMLRGEARRKEWLAVRLLLARMCGASARIVYDCTGKPVLDGADGHISISHTRGYALLAYSADVPVGIDAELVGRDAISFSRRFMNDAFAASLSGDDAAAKALVCWCACEALYKLVGNIGGTYKENVIVKPFELSGKGAVRLSVKGLRAEHERDYVGVYVNDGTLFTLLVKGTDV
jgi:phosphopantetheinyl transferase